MVRTIEVKENKDLNYIECAGVNVPARWTIDQLRDALAKRKIRFPNEEDAIFVFGEAIRLKVELEARNAELIKEGNRLQGEASMMQIKKNTVVQLRLEVDQLKDKIALLERGKGKK